MPNITKWTKLLSDIYYSRQSKCPKCGGIVQGNIYSNDNKVGFAIFECKTCKERVKLSRIKIPKDFVAEKF